MPFALEVVVTFVAPVAVTVASATGLPLVSRTRPLITDEWRAPSVGGKMFATKDSRFFPLTSVVVSYQPSLLPP